MASVRWSRFKRHLSGDAFSFEWVPVQLPYCDESSGMLSKGIREFKVLRHARRLAKQLKQAADPNGRTTILASIPTLDPLYVGAMLRRLGGSNTELVLEIRDVYARPELCEYNSLRRRLEIFKEAMLIRYVDRFIFLTDEIKRRYCSYYPHLPAIQAGVVITNGYDPQEYGPGPAANGPAGIARHRLFRVVLYEPQSRVAVSVPEPAQAKRRSGLRPAPHPYLGRAGRLSAGGEDRRVRPAQARSSTTGSPPTTRSSGNTQAPA